jgi:mRNA interferase MazF
MKEMQRMTGYNRGDVVLVSFKFSNETGEKKRPAVILSSKAYQLHRKETIVAAITSNIERNLIGDHLIEDWKKAGLLYPSLATGIIRTVQQDLVTRKLGTMSQSDLHAIENNLRAIFDL